MSVHTAVSAKAAYHGYWALQELLDGSKVSVWKHHQNIVSLKNYLPLHPFYWKIALYVPVKVKLEIQVCFM